MIQSIMSRRATLAAAGTAVAGFLGGRLSGNDEKKTQEKDTQESTRTSDYTDITSLDVSPNASTVEEYGWFELAAEFEAGTEADMYHHKTIYIVHVGDENVIPQVPMTTYDPGESGTYEQSFLLPDVEDPTTIHVHMDGKVESFDLNLEGASEV